MIKISLLTALALLLQLTVSSQDAAPLRKTLVLKLRQGDGSNGAAVAWHPGQRKYYTGMAGHPGYPLIIFDEKGLQLSGDQLETMTDLRGMWYNPNTRTIQTNGAGNFGWREYDLNIDGIPEGIKILQHGQHQPGANHVGTYNPVADVVYFLDNEEGMKLAIYSMKTATTRYNLVLHLQQASPSQGNEEEEEETDDEYNTTNAVYTGIANMEIALLNRAKGRIELYSLHGLMTATRMLPAGTPTVSTFNFAYANGMYWLFNKEYRQWEGYR